MDLGEWSFCWFQSPRILFGGVLDGFVPVNCRNWMVDKIGKRVGTIFGSSPRTQVMHDTEGSIYRDRYGEVFCSLNVSRIVELTSVWIRLST